MNSSFQRLLAHGAKQSVTLFGNPLSCAVRAGNIEVVRILLAAKTDTQHYWRAAFSNAARHGHLEIMRLLIDFKRSELNYGHYNIAIRQAASGGQVDVLRWLLSESNLFSNEENNRSSKILERAWKGPELWWLEVILLQACRRGHESVVCMALERGAYPTIKFQFPKIQPLDYASSEGYENIVRLLLSRLNARENVAFEYYLNTALCRAARGGWLRISELLLKAGAKVNPDLPINYCLRRRVPWVGAAERGHVDMLQFLLGLGANPKINEEIFEKTIEHAK